MNYVQPNFKLGSFFVRLWHWGSLEHANFSRLVWSRGAWGFNIINDGFCTCCRRFFNQCFHHVSKLIPWNLTIVVFIELLQKIIILFFRDTATQFFSDLLDRQLATSICINIAESKIDILFSDYNFDIRGWHNKFRIVDVSWIVNINFFENLFSNYFALIPFHFQKLSQPYS